MDICRQEKGRVSETMPQVGGARHTGSLGNHAIYGQRKGRSFRNHSLYGQEKKVSATMFYMDWKREQVSDYAMPVLVGNRVSARMQYI